MKLKKGYILLDIVISIFIMSIIITGLYSVTFNAINSKSTIEDKIELNQQLEEMEFQIKSLVENCINIINITTIDGKIVESLQENQVYDVSSIKLNFAINDNDINLQTKKDNQEINFKTNTKKVFINSLYDNNSNKPGGYEIGDYVESIKIKMKSSKLVCITLCLQKNKINLEKEIEMFIKYDK